MISTRSVGLLIDTVVCFSLAKWETVSGRFGGYFRMTLCGISVVFNSFGDVLGLMSCKRSSENGQLLVGFQSTEAFGSLHHTGGGPAQRHRGILPSLYVATDAAHGPHHVLN